jgi:hypothetical protein
MKKNYLKLCLTLVTLSVISSATAQSVDDGMYAYLPFEQNTLDQSGYEVPTEFIGTSAFDRGINKTRYACRFDGTNGVVIRTKQKLYAMSLWIHPENEINASTPVELLAQISETGTKSNLNSSVFYIGNASSLSSEETITLAEVVTSPEKKAGMIYTNTLRDKWTNIILNFNGTSYDIYVGGYKQTFETLPGTSMIGLQTVDNLILGYRKYADGSNDADMNYVGLMDEVRLYNRSLNAEDIEMLSRRNEASDENLLVYLPFTFDFKDQSPYENAVTLIGDPEISECGFSAVFDGDDGIKIERTGIAKAVSFWAKTAVPPDEVVPGQPVLQFYENGVFGENEKGAGAYIGDYTALGSDERFGIAEVDAQTGYSARTMVSTGTFSAGWHHYLMNSNGTGYDLYIDGVKHTVNSGTSDGHVEALEILNPIIGLRVDSTGKISGTGFIGELDDFHIYRAALYPDEISYLARPEGCHITSVATEQTSENRPLVYPTAERGIFKLNQSAEISELQIYSFTGIHSEHAADGNALNLSAMPSGIYIVKGLDTFGNPAGTQKIVIP